MAAATQIKPTIVILEGAASINDVDWTDNYTRQSADTAKVFDALNAKVLHVLNACGTPSLVSQLEAAGATLALQTNGVHVMHFD